MTVEAPTTDSPKHPVTPVSILGNLVRGGLIGVVELVPGVSGGTVALIVGVYQRIVDSGNHVVHGLRRFVTGPDRLQSLRREAGKAEWGLLLPLVIGMFGTLFLVSGVMSGFVTDQPVVARALFLGMVAASVSVPLTLIDWSQIATPRRRAGAVVLVAVGAALAFVLTGFGSTEDITDPHPLLVFGAAAIAICALVLPGVSGSFFLLAIGLYATSTRALSELDLGYIAVFGAGALVGLISFVKVLHWLLHKHHTATMLTMAGLMLGSLRALWPWQGSSREILAPGADWPTMLGLAVLGAGLVMLLVWVDRRRDKQVADQLEPVAADDE